jgi:4'-phosphopantetheinyl transferase
MNGASSSRFVLPADPFESAGYSRYPECRMGRAGDDAGISLTDAELQRVARMQSEAGRQELRGSLIARRQLIAQIAGCAPADVSLTANEDGAPEQASPAGWSVSLSNKSDLTVVALRRAPAEIGVDLEIVKDIQWLPILSMICNEEERRHLERDLGAHPDATRAFFRMWTIKEAVMKATRRGFRAGPKAIETPISILAAPGSGELAAFGDTYRFWTVDIGELIVSLVERRA